MKNDYLQESRRFYAVAQSMELVTKALRIQPDRDTAVAAAVLADLALAQLDRMDKALGDIIEQGRAHV